MNESRTHYLDVMERITRLILQASDLDDLLRSVLREMLDIFDCHRAYFLYPCDPSSPTWRIPMECTRCEWPGVFSPNTDYPMPADALMAEALDTKRALTVGPGNDFPVPFMGAELFHVKSAMVMAIFPRIGKPWQLGIHHCVEARVYSPSDRKIMEGIGHFVADALTGFITLRNLHESEQRLRTLVEHAPEAIVVFDFESGHFTMANRNAVKLFGYNEETLCTSDFTRLHAANQSLATESFDEYMQQTIRGRAPVFEWVFQDAQGHPKPCEVRLVRLPAQHGVPIRASFIDIGTRIASDAQRRLLYRALEQTADAVIITDHQGVIEYVNSAFESMTGYLRQEAVGKKPNIIRSDQHDAMFYQKLWTTIRAGGVFNEVFINRRRNGTLFYEEKTITPLKDEKGVITHFIATGKDITERIEIQERLHHLAHHDMLTGLPNRALLLDRLSQSIARAPRQGRTVAVLFLDLDNFKNINDSLGHTVGDSLLRAMAERLERCVRDGDTVARLGGDEFAVVLDDVTAENEIPPIATKILSALAQAMEVEGHELYVTSSIGVSVFPGDGIEPQTLLKNADLAMYRAKELGRNTFQFFTREMSSKVLARLSMETSLRQALQREEFCLYYQPQLDLRSGTITGVEALLRWRHPQLGLTSPTDFVHILEETGLIEPVGEWVLHTACAQQRRWAESGLGTLRMAVNVSPRQFERGNPGGRIATIVAETGISPAMLELEITESVLIRNETRALELLQEISILGMTLALDDFGTGYSSLIYLKRFPITTVKIDRSFIKGIQSDSSDAAIVRGIISMAKGLGLTIVAEGVENDAQRTLLHELGCDQIQGWVVSPPVPSEELTRWLAKQSPLERTLA
ncbi:MAG: EAL domain-containing protein [Pseudomonadota bacterium]